MTETVTLTLTEAEAETVKAALSMLVSHKREQLAAIRYDAVTLEPVLSDGHSMSADPFEDLGAIEAAKASKAHASALHDTVLTGLQAIWDARRGDVDPFADLTFED